MKQATLKDDHDVRHEVTHKTEGYVRIRCFGGALPWSALEYVPVTCLECLCLRSKQ